MARWQSTLKIAKEWKLAETKELSVQELAKAISNKLRKLRPCKDEDILTERDEIADRFEDLSLDETADVNDFDDILEDLYDWADTPLGHGKKVCWIERWKDEDSNNQTV